MNSNSTIVDGIAANLERTYTPDLFLGYLAWYSIQDGVVVTRDEFVTTLADYGVDAGTVSKVHATGVFKRACNAAQVKKFRPTAQDIIDYRNAGMTHSGQVSYVNYMIRDAGYDKDGTYRNIIREAVDAQDAHLSHDEIIKVSFMRKTKTIVTERLAHLTPVERRIIDTINDFYREETETLPNNSIRGFINQEMQGGMFSVRVRPTGGVFYVRSTHSTRLHNLEDAINAIGGGFHTLPLVDDTKQREMLRIAYETETQAEVEGLMTEIREIMMAGTKITRDRYVDIKMRTDHQQAKVSEYSDLLTEGVERTGSYLEILAEQVEELLEFVDNKVAA